MKNALDMNEVSTLSTVLLSNLDESIFFSKVSKFVQNQFNEYKVLVFESFEDGSTQLRSENGKIIEKSEVIAKGEGLSGYVTRVKRAYYSNSKRDPLLASSKREEKVEAELCVPITVDEMVLGTIHVQTVNQERKFSEADVIVIRELLDNLAAPIKNLKMYLLAKHLNRQLLNKIAEKEEELQLVGTIRPATGGKSFQQKVEIVGHSASIMEINNIAQKVAAQDFPIMIIGESGSGKKLLARKIHSLSPRAQHLCEVIHCSAINQDQIESEIFGNENMAGVIERASNGTLIIDAIEELSLDLQAKLLRVILSGEVYRVGSKRPVSVNVRFVTVSRQPLEQMVEEGAFKSDLLYRLNTIKIEMPSLVDRKDDIKVLSEHFMNNGKDKEDYKMLTSKAIEKLMSYRWPGNVQELRNIMERTYILTDGRYIDEADLPEFEVECEVIEEVEDTFTEMTLHDLEKKHIIGALEHLGGNKTRAAKMLGITVKTLYNKLHSYGLVQPKAE